DVENRKSAVSAPISWRIERADLRGNVRLESSISQNEKTESHEKQMFESHQEMPDGHQRCADDHRSALAEYAVGHQSTEDWRQVDQPRIEAVDLRGERLRRQWAKYEFQSVLEGCKSEHLRGTLRREQILDHVKDKKGSHSVIGKALPHFRREQVGQSPRMSKDFITLAGLRAEKSAHGGHVGSDRMVAGQTISHRDKHVFLRLNSVYGFSSFTGEHKRGCD